VRRALYMATLSALRHAGFLAEFVARMKDPRKPAKVILIAVARKLLTIANAVLRGGQPFAARAIAA
jgi:transposase